MDLECLDLVDRVEEPTDSRSTFSASDGVLISTSSAPRVTNSCSASSQTAMRCSSTSFHDISIGSPIRTPVRSRGAEVGYAGAPASRLPGSRGS